MEYSEKLKLYKQGKYLFEPPPVCPARWDIKAWIKFIDLHGKWLTT